MAIMNNNFADAIVGSLLGLPMGIAKRELEKFVEQNQPTWLQVDRKQVSILTCGILTLGLTPVLGNIGFPLGSIVGMTLQEYLWPSISLADEKVKEISEKTYEEMKKELVESGAWTFYSDTRNFAQWLRNEKGYAISENQEDMIASYPFDDVMNTKAINIAMIIKESKEKVIELAAQYLKG